MRNPYIAGVAGGVGTTTIAQALTATDCGIYRAGQPVDAVVCRDTVASLGCAHRVVGASRSTPLLVVVASTPSSPPKQAGARVEMVRPWVSGVIRVPYIKRWREVVDPWSEAALVLRGGEEQVASWLRGFATAMRQLHTALVERLRAQPAPPPSPPRALPASPPRPSQA